MSAKLKTVTMYEIREYVGIRNSKYLGRKLRSRASALRIVRKLKKQGREVFSVSIKIAVSPA